ncbi:MAG TPA: dihydrofolate reductase [Pseudolabrys sp.]|nr:dihydrofolate reductase [Pseudolabrys sp.]
MGAPTTIVGFAIVSNDGMLADANGVMPDALKLDADQRYFIAGMNRMQVVVHGRHSHERQPNSLQRHRITVSNRVKAIEPDPDNAKGILWNPAGVSFEEAWARLGVEGGLGVVGGTSVFGMFLDRYDDFHLSRAAGVRLPGGRPVFPDVPRLTPEAVMSRHGLEPGATQTLDAAHGVTVTVWRRRA